MRSLVCFCIAWSAFLIGGLAQPADFERIVGSQAELYAALSSSSVETIILTADITMSPDPRIPGSAASGVFDLTCNKSLRAQDVGFDAWFPMLDFTAIRSPRIRIPEGVWFSYQHLVLVEHGRPIGYELDFIDPRSEGVITSQDILRMVGVCPNPALSVASCPNMQRPPTMPGVQQCSLRSGQWCASPPPGSPLQGQCWPFAFHVEEQVALRFHVEEQVAPPLFSDPGGPANTTTNYTVIVTNITIICENIISDECMKKLGIAACFRLIIARTTPPSPPPLGPPALSHRPPTATRNGSGGGNGGGGGDGTTDDTVTAAPDGSSPFTGVLVGAIVGAVGGTLLLAAAAAFLIVRRYNAGAGGGTKPWQKARWSFGRPEESEHTSETHLSTHGGGGGSGRAAEAEAGGARVALDMVALDISRLSGEGEMGGASEVSGNESSVESAVARPHMAQELNDLSAAVQTAIADNQLSLEKVIGSGAFGTVYRGCWQGLPVAVKIQIFSGHSLGPGGLTKQRMLMEAALSKSISHPNVVSTYCCEVKPVPVLESVKPDDGKSLQITTSQDNVMDDWRLFIIQEFCDGGSLRCILHERSFATSATDARIDMEMVLHLATNVAQGMCHLHERNIVHGDLNPANVLLKCLDPHARRPAEACVAKVCDFGYSVRLPDDRSHVSNSRHGTPFYIAPEVARLGNMSKAADVYDMGIILWELYTGKSVWRVIPSGEFVLRSAFPQLPDDAPMAYRELVIACLQYDHTRRPTFPEVLDRLLDMQLAVAFHDNAFQVPMSVGSSQPESMHGGSAPGSCCPSSGTASQSKAPLLRVAQRRSSAGGDNGNGDNEHHLRHHQHHHHLQHNAGAGGAAAAATGAAAGAQAAAAPAPVAAAAATAPSGLSSRPSDALTTTDGLSLPQSYLSYDDETSSFPLQQQQQLQLQLQSSNSCDHETFVALPPPPPPQQQQQQHGPLHWPSAHHHDGVVIVPPAVLPVLPRPPCRDGHIALTAVLPVPQRPAGRDGGETLTQLDVPLAAPQPLLQPALCGTLGKYL